MTSFLFPALILLAASLAVEYRGRRRGLVLSTLTVITATYITTLVR